MQKIDAQAVEPGRVLDAACVAGARQNLVYRTGHEASGFPSSRKRVVMLPVDHQRRDLHGRQPRGRIGMIAGHEDLRDGFAPQPRLTLDELVEEVPPEPAVSE